MSSPTGRVALVTGASSGIGEAAATALAAAGFTVYGTSRRATPGKRRGEIAFVPLDVTDDASVAAAIEDVLARSGRIDVLVNNAGVGLLGAAEECSVDEARALYETNLFGVIRVTQAVLPHLRERGGGRILNVSSVLGLIPQPYLAVYASSKWALEGWTESLDHELRELGVRALLVEPGLTNTAFEANQAVAGTPLQAYADRRAQAERTLAEGVRAGDDASVVAAAVVAAATDARPRLRYPAGPLARRVGAARRFAPARIFDRQIRKTNGLPV